MVYLKNVTVVQSHRKFIHAILSIRIHDLSLFYQHTKNNSHTTLLIHSRFQYHYGGCSYHKLGSVVIKLSRIHCLQKHAEPTLHVSINLLFTLQIHIQNNAVILKPSPLSFSIPLPDKIPSEVAINVYSPNTFQRQTP